jgi:hypothetical protein
LYVVVSALRWRLAGHDWAHSLPRGYLASLWGVAIFALGGLADMGWHILYGVEVSVAATVSPTHLVLFLGVGLIYLGPLRAALARNDGSTGWDALPKILSLTYFWMACTFFTQYASPFATTFSAAAFRESDLKMSSFAQSLAMSSLLLQTALMVGFFAFAASRFRLPRWTFTVALTLETLATGIMRAPYLRSGVLPVVLAALVAGVLCDLLYAKLEPTPARKREWLLMWAAVPAIVFAVYFATVTVVAGTWWTPHLLFGAPVLAAGAGYLIAWLTLDRNSYAHLGATE